MTQPRNTLKTSNFAIQVRNDFLAALAEEKLSKEQKDVIDHIEDKFSELENPSDSAIHEFKTTYQQKLNQLPNELKVIYINTLYARAALVCFENEKKEARAKLKADITLQLAQDEKKAQKQEKLEGLKAKIDNVNERVKEFNEWINKDTYLELQSINARLENIEKKLSQCSDEKQREKLHQTFQAICLHLPNNINDNWLDYNAKQVYLTTDYSALIEESNLFLLGYNEYKFSLLKKIESNSAVILAKFYYYCQQAEQFITQQQRTGAWKKLVEKQQQICFHFMGKIKLPQIETLISLTQIKEFHNKIINRVAQLELKFAETPKKVAVIPPVTDTDSTSSEKTLSPRSASPKSQKSVVSQEANESNQKGRGWKIASKVFFGAAIVFFCLIPLIKIFGLFGGMLCMSAGLKCNEKAIAANRGLRPAPSSLKLTEEPADNFDASQIQRGLDFTNCNVPYQAMPKEPTHTSTAPSRAVSANKAAWFSFSWGRKKEPAPELHRKNTPFYVRRPS